MSAKHFYYTRENSSIDTRFDPDEDDRDDDDSDCEFLLQDVPYSSSSIDRSSINSIPWADDAIKQNQMDWERVERMLNGEETLPNDEPELRNEILEWQRKFPILMIPSESSSLQQKQRSFDSSQIDKNDDSLDVETISNLSLTSVNDEADDDRKYEKLETPNLTMYGNKSVLEHRQERSAYNSRSSIDREHMLDVELQISSIPIRQRQDLQHPNTNARRQIIHTNQRGTSTSASSVPLVTPALDSRKSPNSLLIVSRPRPPSSAIISNTHTRLRMPPILNVLETKRRFRGLTNNRSFVQLTQIQQQQAKSAAVTHTHYQEQRRHSQHMDSWNKPLAATRITNSFLNNRNSIILPAIKLQRIHELPISTTTTTSTNDLRSLSNSTLGSGDIVGRRIYNFAAPFQRNFNTTTTSTTPSTGRSISAAVHHQRQEFNAIYLPYSASKFKVFK